MARFIPSRTLVTLLALLAPVSAHARTLGVNLGTSLSVEAILTNIINYMAGAIVFLASALFTVGAFYITFSRGEADAVTKGKNYMISAVIGMAVVLGSFAILRTVFYFIYA
jgi:hypothetical protein